MKFLELFSGIGGFRRAADLIYADTKFKMKCIGYSEIDRHALATYEANYDISDETKMLDIIKFTSEKSNISKLDNIDLLLGGFPCQSFSIVGKQKGFEDERGKILFSIHEILKIKKPSFVILENVRNIVRLNQGETLKEILHFFKKHGYKYRQTVVLDSQNFGLPQTRKRIFFVCSRKELEIDLSEQAIIENFKSLEYCSLKRYRNVRSILQKHVDEKYYLSSKIKRTILAGAKNFNGNSQIDLPIARPLTATMVKLHRASQDNYYSNDFILKGKSHINTPKEILYNKPVRRLTGLEALKLQGFDSNFFANSIRAGVSEYQLRKQAGNALSVNTGYALLHYLFIKCKIHKM